MFVYANVISSRKIRQSVHVLKSMFVHANVISSSKNQTISSCISFEQDETSGLLNRISNNIKVQTYVLISNANVDYRKSEICILAIKVCGLMFPHFS